MKNTNKTNKQEIKTVESVEEIKTVETVETAETVEEVETLSTLFTKRIQEALDTEATLVNIPVLKNDLSDFNVIPFETYLPKYIQDSKIAKKCFKNAIVTACYQVTRAKAKKHYDDLQKNNTYVITDEGIEQWYKVKECDGIFEITDQPSDTKDVEYISNYKELSSTFNLLDRTFNEICNNIDSKLMYSGNIIIKMIVSKICKTQLPEMFIYSQKNDEKKDNTLINNIVHHSTLILQGLNTWKNAEGKSVSLEKQVKADVTKFYNEKIKPTIPEGGYGSEVIKNFNGACNTQMFRRVFSIINDGFKINEKGVLIPVYSGKKLGRELADMYISYLQGEFSIDNSK